LILSNEAIREISKEITGAIMKEVKAELENMRGSEYIRKTKACEFFDVSEKTLREWERLELIKYKASAESRAVLYKIAEVYENMTRF
jgi:DNA-binding transcriptional regulator YiaG